MNGASHGFQDDGGLGVVRIKPLGAGGGGVELPAGAGDNNTSAVQVTSARAVTVTNWKTRMQKTYDYPTHVISADTGQEDLYRRLMPQRVEAFLAGRNANIIAFGQTGSGKTHTMFGPPGIMARAGAGEFGTSVEEGYGLCPRGIIDIFYRVKSLREEGELQYVLTGSAVELTCFRGNVDMLTNVKAPKPSLRFYLNSNANGVAIDKVSDPPRMFGQIELPIDSAEDVLQLFGAIATRNTAGTGLNDSSSRSHCFVFLTLHAHDPSTGRVRRSRFQFVDLAGSERLDEAHHNTADLLKMEGSFNNFTLITLSQCVHGLVAARAKKTKFSFKAFITDLVLLLQDTMTGDALTMLVVCISSAPANSTQSTSALDFGKTFSQLTMREKAKSSKPVSAGKLRRQAVKQLAEAEGVIAKGTTPRYLPVRQAQVRDANVILGILDRFGSVDS